MAKSSTFRKLCAFSICKNRNAKTESRQGKLIFFYEVRWSVRQTNLLGLFSHLFMSTTIRKATESDFPQILALFQEFATFEKRPHKMQNSLERMQEEKDYFHCYVVETDAGKIVGYASYFYCYFTWSGKGMHLEDLYIQPAYRGTGTGTRLLQTIIDLARTTGCHKLQWQVSKWNDPAIAFYQKMGAEIDDVEQNCELALD